MGSRIPLRPVAARAITALAVVAAGAALTASVAAARSMPGRDAVALARTAAAAAVIAAVAGCLVLWVLRRRSIGLQIGVVALTTLTAVAIGAWWAARDMFLSAHDAAALDVILAASGTAGLLVALALGDAVGRASRALVDRTREIGEGRSSEAPRGTAPGEWARLSDELEQMQRRLTDARDRERAMDRSRRELVAWISHDLRTPLAGIRAVAEALEDGVVEDPATVERYYRTLREESERLSGLIDDLFELSRAQAGVLRLEYERVSLGDLVSDALSGVAPVAQAKGVRLEGRLDGPPPELECSTPEVLRALRNILENAIRHTPADGTVVVEAGGEGPAFAYVSVLDTGGGVAEADLDRVFEAAWRGDPARGRDSGGAGLGLTIARSLVEAHRGEITVHNEDGGCRFTVRLPVESAAQAAPAAPAATDG